MLKKFLGVLFMLGSCIACITQGEYIADIGFNYNSPRTITNQQTNNGGEYTYTTDNIGNFKTTKDSTEHNFRYFTRYGNPNSFMVMGRKNGQIYVFLTQTNTSNTVTIQNQGYVSGFAILPSDYEFNTGGNIKNNIPLTTDRNTIKTILGKHNIIGFHANNKNDSQNGGNSASQYYGNFMFFANNYVSNYCLITDDITEHYICFRNSTRATNTNFYENNLTGSENKTTTSRKDITQFDTFYDEESPITQGGQEPQTNTGCINIMTQITMYGYKYNTGLCYTNNQEWSGTLYEGERITVTPKSIFEIFNSYNEYQTWKGIYENSCHAPYTQEYCLSRMQDKPYATEIFSKIENAGLEPMKVYQYCHLQLNFTEEEKRSTDKCTAVESGTYYATGVTSGEANPNPIEGITNVLQEGSEIVLPADDTVFDEILPDGILSWKDVATNVNFMKTFLNVGKKMLIIFRIREYREGIIPSPISSLILLFILFHLIRKK